MDFRTDIFTIHNYQLVGVPENEMGELKVQIQILSDQKVFYFLPGNRIISYNRAKIKDLIFKKFSNTAEIKIYPYGLHTMKIVVTSYVPLFRINDKEAITKEGVVYKEENNIFDLPKLEVSSTTKITPEILVPLAKIVPQINAVLYPVKNIVIDEYGDIRLLDGDRKSAVILLANNDIEKVWSNIISAIDTEPLKSKLEKNPEDLLYLDTRFGNKVFYKFTPLDNYKTNSPPLVGSTTLQ